MALGNMLAPANMVNLVRYKSRKHGMQARRNIFGLLCNQTAWMGKSARTLTLASGVAVDDLVRSDHDFDAWLCALTAWSHDCGETRTWSNVPLKKSDVDIEGHIAILDT